MNQSHLFFGLIVAAVASAFACDRKDKSAAPAAAARTQALEGGVAVGAMTVAPATYVYRVVGRGALDSYGGSAQIVTASWDGASLNATLAVDGEVQETVSHPATAALRPLAEVQSQAIGLLTRAYRALPDAAHPDGAWGTPAAPPDEAAANQAFAGIIERDDADYVATDAIPAGDGTLVRVRATHYTKIEPNDFVAAVSAQRVAGGLDAFPTGRQSRSGSSVTDLYVDASGRGVVVRAEFDVEGSDTSYLTCLQSQDGASPPAATFPSPLTPTPARFAECAQ